MTRYRVAENYRSLPKCTVKLNLRLRGSGERAVIVELDFSRNVWSIVSDPRNIWGDEQRELGYALRNARMRGEYYSEESWVNSLWLAMEPAFVALGALEPVPE